MSASTKNLLALTEGILAGTSPVKEIVTKADPIVDDGIKSVVVPDSYVNHVVGFSKALSESQDPEAKQELLSQVEPIDEAEMLQGRLESLVGRLKDLLKEAKVVLEEMNTTGGVGYSAANRKKNGSRRRNKRNKGY